MKRLKAGTIVRALQTIELKVRDQVITRVPRDCCGSIVYYIEGAYGIAWFTFTPSGIYKFEVIEVVARNFKVVYEAPAA